MSTNATGPLTSEQLTSLPSLPPSDASSPPPPPPPAVRNNTARNNTSGTGATRVANTARTNTNAVAAASTSSTAPQPAAAATQPVAAASTSSTATQPAASTSSAAAPAASLIAFGTTQYRKPKSTYNGCDVTVGKKVNKTRINGIQTYKTLFSAKPTRIAFFITGTKPYATLYTYSLNGNTPTNLLETQAITKENLMVSLTGGKRKQKKQKGGVFDFGATPCFSYQDMVLYTPNTNAKEQYGFGGVTQQEVFNGLTYWISSNYSKIGLSSITNNTYYQTSFTNSPCASLQVENPADNGAKKTALTALLQAVVTAAPAPAPEAGATKDVDWANGNETLKTLANALFNGLDSTYPFAATASANAIGITDNGKITVADGTTVKNIDPDMLTAIRTAITNLRTASGVGDMKPVVEAAYGIVGVVYKIQSQQLNLCLNNFLYEILS